MSKYYLRIVLIPITLFTVVLLLNHAQPHDDYELRAALLPSAHCPAPCFMGIRPGVTTVDEAIKILKASGWVEQYNYEQYVEAIRVKWNDQRPMWLGNSKPYGLTYIYTKNGLVNQLFVETDLMLGAVQLGIGQPPFQQISLNYINGQYYLFYVALYPNENINMSISRDCSHEKGHINYLNKVFLNYSQSDIATNIPPTYHRSWFDVIHTVCR